MNRQATCLLVEEFSNVEDSLELLAVKSVEKDTVVGLAKQRQSLHGVNHFSHRVESSLDFLGGLHECRQRVSHVEHREVLLVKLGLLGRVIQDVHESALVFLVTGGQVAVTWQVDSVKLLKQGTPLLFTQVVVDRNDADTGLL